MLTRMPKKGDRIVLDSGGMFPDSDGKKYLVTGRMDKHPDILKIRDEATGINTYVIGRFTDGYNSNITITQKQ